jgi:hypothetical protein
MVFFLDDMSMNPPWWWWLSNTLSKDCGTTFGTFHSRNEGTWHESTYQTDAQCIVNEVVHVMPYHSSSMNPYGVQRTYMDGGRRPALEWTHER